MYWVEQICQCLFELFGICLVFGYCIDQDVINNYIIGYLFYGCCCFSVLNIKINVYWQCCEFVDVFYLFGNFVYVDFCGIGYFFE